MYVGDGNNITHSWLRLAARLPFEFVCACPEGFEPDAATMKLVQDAGAGTAVISHDAMDVSPSSLTPFAGLIGYPAWHQAACNSVCRPKSFGELDGETGLLSVSRLSRGLPRAEQPWQNSDPAIPTQMTPWPLHSQRPRQGSPGILLFKLLYCATWRGVGPGRNPPLLDHFKGEPWQIHKACPALGLPPHLVLTY